MEQRRFLLFVSLSLVVWIGWINFVMPKFFPPPPKPAPNPAAAQQLPPEDDLPPADALVTENVRPEPVGVPQNPPQTITLGSLDPETDYFMHVELTTQGAAIRTIELNDFPEFGNRNQPLQIVGSDGQTDLRTFETAIPELDRQLPPGGNRFVNWEFIPETQTDTLAEFRLKAPDGSLEVVKRYELKAPPANQPLPEKPRDNLPSGYELVLTMEFRNLSPAAKKIEYALQGPVGLPLEDVENSSKWRDLRMGFLQSDGSVEKSQLSASEVFDQDADQKIERWDSPVQYIGVDVKYFAALVHPLGDQLKSPTVKSTMAQLVTPMRQKKYSDISVVLNGQADLAPAGAAEATVPQSFLLYAGPKRQVLLADIGAESIVDFGYVNVIARFMLLILNTFHRLGASYGVAIILLTVAVRLCMFPVSRHQAHNMQRMKDLQPKIKEIQQKHKDNKEELARAQMELFRKHNYNPLGGCLPLFLQLPIFIGLYTALSSSVDLRMARFLWIDNLASPDALFKLPFVVPFLGWTDFNLLPILSTALMFFQQKMLMPPPADEEQAMQQKMMNFMMIFFGAMFYRVPAGLCLYFIASSVWGMVERWILSKLPQKKLTTSAAEAPGGVTPLADTPSRAAASRVGVLCTLLQQAAETEVTITRAPGTGASRNGKNTRR
jgi:YidC/Oxa1 family membrane protein insertase